MPSCQLNTTEKIRSRQVAESLAWTSSSRVPIPARDFNSVLEISEGRFGPDDLCADPRREKDIGMPPMPCDWRAQAHPHGYRRFAPAHYDKLRSTPEKILEQAVEAVKYIKSYVEDVGSAPKTPGAPILNTCAPRGEAAITDRGLMVNIPDTTGYCRTPTNTARRSNARSTRIQHRQGDHLLTHCHNDFGHGCGQHLERHPQRCAATG